MTGINMTKNLDILLRFRKTMRISKYKKKLVDDEESTDQTHI